MSLSKAPIDLDDYYYWTGTPSVGGFQPIHPAVADAQCTFATHWETVPSDLFSVQINNCTKAPGYRFVRTTYPKQMLIFVDGSSLGNGSPAARAGYGVVYAPVEWTHPISGRLEQDGNPQTNNRAELRAALAALGLRPWIEEGFTKIVLACDSQYVVRGISEWILVWGRNEWRASNGVSVVNQDLWWKLQAKLRDLEEEGILVQFWWIPRGLNEADEYAKSGAVRPLYCSKIFDLFTFITRKCTLYMTKFETSWPRSGSPKTL